MPLRTLRYIIIEADTRTLEMFMALGSLTWGLWLLGSCRHLQRTELMHVVHLSGGYWVWVAWSLVNAGFQLFSLWYLYPRLRRWSSSSAGIYWIHVGFMTGTIEPLIFVPLMAGLFAMGNLWIVLHRAAIGK